MYANQKSMMGLTKADNGAYKGKWTRIDASGYMSLTIDRNMYKHTLLEGPAQAHIQALNLTEGMCAPAMAWLA